MDPHTCKNDMDVDGAAQVVNVPLKHVMGHHERWLKTSEPSLVAIASLLP
ncbi:hypothetical protein PtA15_3A59 [Puccinia triticina]|uniref:Uncharacterized protein n=1 Tax=Puccinia triticina TaxID=208348 RepID=A0ABY7CD56_9BASI|nr:uncharacterized protein PtA15_3A59 [Puccinia triticina]WAQ82695.1 hypothetical protein PtA15_3A59 [Puccinia triticina]